MGTSGKRAPRRDLAYGVLVEHPDGSCMKVVARVSQSHFGRELPAVFTEQLAQIGGTVSQRSR